MADTADRLVPVRRALLSVSDKTGLAAFAAALHAEFHVELISTGGTARSLRDAGLPVTDVAELTGFPEMMDGRVKTLHPAVHGGLLARRDHADHLAAMAAHGIRPIDLVCINLYPFQQTVERPGVSFDEAVENIDIGGPAMVRSAAKNHAWVVVVTSPARYDKVLGDLRKHDGRSCGKLRLKQAQSAFAHTADYDGRIARYLATFTTPAVADDASETKPPMSSAVAAVRAAPADDIGGFIDPFAYQETTLRYGENPHQRAALYVGEKPHEASVAFAKQHHGKELSYINLLDADGALACVKEFAAPAACIVKHTTPCGCATADDIATAFRRAYDGDPLAAFGGIVALNKPVDLAAAEAITSIDKLLEVIVAPYYAADALDLLRSRWKNVRLLEVGPIVQGDPSNPARRDASEINLHKIAGGYLVQERDLLGLDESTWRVASQRPPTAAEMADLRFAWLTCKHVKSNAIVVCKGGMLLGAGAGQMDRPSAARLAVGKAGDRAGGSVAASDAFFPFPDGPRLLLDADVTAIIHPGGSLKDQDTIDLIDARGAALVLTGQRHFKH